MAEINRQDSVRQLCYQHGLMTFLLFFVPLLPGFVEINTAVYLRVLEALNFDISTAEDAVGLVFGKRGLKTYAKFKHVYPHIIRPPEIFRILYKEEDLQAALKQIATVFFDADQKNDLYSDLIRATIIREIPHMCQAYPLEKHQWFRSQLVQRLASAVITSLAIAPHLAAVDTCYTLLTSISFTGKQRKEVRIAAELEALASRIKAELAHKYSAYTAPPLTDYCQRFFPRYLFTTEDVLAMKQSLIFLAGLAAPEVRDAAKDILFRLPGLHLEEAYDVPSTYPLRRFT